MLTLDKVRIGVIGLGYVGLPLALEFGKRYPTVGFDISAARIAELESGKDSTLEAEPEELAAAEHLTYSSNPKELSGCNVYVVTVPTPVGRNNRPLLTPLKLASETVEHVVIELSGDALRVVVGRLHSLNILFAVKSDNH